eukprot:CAMPEP_0182557432 /NCGR_PEP_ID=MMETSP1324-20130603/1333_1 /TAXON_ID=236786 /ORGANISM="Florenciella sp., Strain RCC1587" /LENGTH=56 /DNA_ID=CAMNT_0024769481 /DNA_START=190 /DNA_END=357 /DNA_ORIENTATION=+
MSFRNSSRGGMSMDFSDDFAPTRPRGASGGGGVRARLEARQASPRSGGGSLARKRP